jgi:hypothetical protein
MTSFLHVDLQIAAIGKRRTMIIFAGIYRFKYFFFEKTDIWKSRFLYFIAKKKYLKRYIPANMIIVLLFPIAAICRSTWRKEVIIYVLLSFQCDLHENLHLIIIFFTLLLYDKIHNFMHYVQILLKLMP